MIRIRRGVVAVVRERRPGLLDVRVDIGSGVVEDAIAYPALCGPVAAGDRVVLNTTAVALGLGTGGAHFVVAVEGGPDVDLDPGVHAMKWRYTPLQGAVRAAEEGHLPERLDGVPVVAAGLHSAVAPVAIAARATTPDLRVGLVWTDGAALPLAYSDTVAHLRERGLLGVTVTSGQAFGGDLEAVNVWSGLLAARGAGAEAIVVAMGPGNLGTASRYGFATMEVAAVLNAAGALGGDPIAVLRLSFADERQRHRGVSHHSVTALRDATLVRATVPVPSLPAAEAAVAAERLAQISARHDVVEVGLGAAEDALRANHALLGTMGRGYEDDPHFFRAAGAAGVLAARRARP